MIRQRQYRKLTTMNPQNEGPMPKKPVEKGQKAGRPICVYSQDFSASKVRGDEGPDRIYEA